MVTPALENVALWHERDISHSSVERMMLCRPGAPKAEYQRQQDGGARDDQFAMLKRLELPESTSELAERTPPSAASSSSAPRTRSSAPTPAGSVSACRR